MRSLRATTHTTKCMKILTSSSRGSSSGCRAIGRVLARRWDSMGMRGLFRQACRCPTRSRRPSRSISIKAQDLTTTTWRLTGEALGRSGRTASTWRPTSTCCTSSTTLWRPPTFTETIPQPRSGHTLITTSALRTTSCPLSPTILLPKILLLRTISPPCWVYRSACAS